HRFRGEHVLALGETLDVRHLRLVSFAYSMFKKSVVFNQSSPLWTLRPSALSLETSSPKPLTIRPRPSGSARLTSRSRLRKTSAETRLEAALVTALNASLSPRSSSPSTAWRTPT